jgi:hypothetical protein
LQVERQRRRQQTDPIANGAGRQAFRTTLDEQSINCQPVFVSERAQGGDDGGGFHLFTILQVFSYCQACPLPIVLKHTKIDDHVRSPSPAEPVNDLIFSASAGVTGL